MSLTKSLALELGPRMIRVNCVAPDVIPTPGSAPSCGVHTPLPRAGHVDDIAGAVVFLASDALSGFVTGTTIHVDGGNLAAGGWRRQDDGSYTTTVKFGIAARRARTRTSTSMPPTRPSGSATSRCGCPSTSCCRSR